MTCLTMVHEPHFQSYIKVPLVNYVNYGGGGFIRWRVSHSGRGFLRENTVILRLFFFCETEKSLTTRATGFQVKRLNHMLDEL